MTKLPWLKHIYHEVLSMTDWYAGEEAIISKSRAAEILGVSLSDLYTWQKQDKPPTADEILEMIKKRDRTHWPRAIQVLAEEVERVRAEVPCDECDGAGWKLVQMENHTADVDCKECQGTGKKYNAKDEVK
jgi:transposase